MIEPGRRPLVPPRTPLSLLVAACALLAGCGSPAAGIATLPTAAPATTSAAAVPTSVVTPSHRPTRAPHPTGDAAPANPRLPWPAATPQGAVALQHQVDDGAQPWLLDPVQVAQSYAASLGWRDPQVSGSGTASPVHVTVRSSAGVHALTLMQPGTRGPAGIWLVAADAG